MTENRRYLWLAGLAGVVVGVASISAIGIASASDDRGGPSASVPGDHHGWRGGGPWGGWRGGWGGGDLDGILGADVTDMLHGEVVLAKEGGGTQTVLVQKGAVTAVSANSVTVKSGDGYTKSYAVNGDTKVKADEDEIGSVAKDEQVVVVAPKSGDTQTATVLVDLTDLGWK